MVISTVPHYPTQVKPLCKKFDRFANPSPEEIPSLWAELSALATLAPKGEQAGIHRRRTRLLDGVPTWMLPQVLDSLTTEGATV